MATVAMNSAISGLNAFQTAINYISDNVANSQTIGFKRIDAISRAMSRRRRSASSIRAAPRRAPTS